MAAKPKQPRQTKPRVNTNGAKSPTIAFRVRGDLYDRLKASAEARGYSLSEEIEHRLNASISDEGLMAALPRLIAEGIAADREVQRAALLPRFAQANADQGQQRADNLANLWNRQH